MPDRLADLHEQLLRAGIAPAHAGRYLRELADHRQDLAEHLETAGLSPRAAQSEAERRLGNVDTLLLPMLADRRFRSRAARWPALFYLALPLAMQAALALVGVMLLIFADTTPLRPGMADLGDGLGLVWLIAPVLIAWLTLLAAYRRRAALFWPILGAIAGAMLASMLQLSVSLPSPEAGGQIGVTIGLPGLLPLAVLVALSLLPLSLRPA